MSHINCRLPRKIRHGDSGRCTSCSLYSADYECKEVKRITIEATKQPAQTTPTMIRGIPLLSFTPTSAKALIPRVIQKADQGDMSEISSTIPTIISITPAPANPISSNKLFTSRIVLQRRLNVNQ